jgi:hypothetical protein
MFGMINEAIIMPDASVFRAGTSKVNRKLTRALSNLYASARDYQHTSRDRIAREPTHRIMAHR